MEYNYTTSQAPDKGVQVGPEPIPMPDATLAMTQANNPGFGGNFIEVGIVTNENKSAVYTSKAYPANADGKQRPGATVEYSSEFSVGESIWGVFVPVSPLPEGYIAAEFLEGTGSQYVVLPEFIFSSEDDIEWLIAFSNYPSTGNFGVWSCTNAFTVRQVAVMSMNQYIFNFFGGEIYSGTLEPGVYAFRNNGLYINGNLKKSLSLTPKNTTSLYLFCQRYNNVPSYFAPVALSYFKIKDKLNLLPAIDALGAPCMFDAKTKTPYYNSGSGTFVVGLNLKHARELAKLPTTGGALTISLPEGYEADAAVDTALQTARANGWIITVQTYEAEATASTFGMRRIWVRKTQDEHGIYVDADGTRYNVDWCVAMYTPDGSEPDAHGYEMFQSVDAATEYWGLIPWVDPEQEKELLQEL